MPRERDGDLLSGREGERNLEPCEKISACLTLMPFCFFPGRTGRSGISNSDEGEPSGKKIRVEEIDGPGSRVCNLEVEVGAGSN